MCRFKIIKSTQFYLEFDTEYAIGGWEFIGHKVFECLN